MKVEELAGPTGSERFVRALPRERLCVELVRAQRRQRDVRSMDAVDEAVVPHRSYARRRQRADVLRGVRVDLLLPGEVCALRRAVERRDREERVRLVAVDDTMIDSDAHLRDRIVGKVRAGYR